MLFKKYRYIFAFAISFSAFAGTGEELLNEHTLLRQSKSSHYLVQNSGDLLDRTQRFISTPEGKQFVGTEEGKKLLHHQKWLNNYQYINFQISGCGRGTGITEINKHIMNSALSYDVIDDCNDVSLTEYKNSAGSFTALANLASDMSDIHQHEVFNNIWQTTLRNTLFTQAAHKLKYSAVLNTTANKEKLVEDLVKEACFKRDMRACPDPDALKKDLTRYVNGVASKIKSTSAQDAAKTINDKMEKLSKKLEGFKDISSDEVSSIAQNQNFKDYQKEYQNFISKNEGLLVFSSTLEDKLAFKSADTDHMDKTFHLISSSVYNFEPYEKVKEDDIKKAIIDVDEKIAEHVSELQDDVFRPDLFKTKDGGGALIDLVKYSPQAVAEYLIQHPQDAKMMCQLIGKIEYNKDSDDSSRSVKRFGGMVVGLGLMATGVGAGAGAAVFAGSTGAGTALAISTASLSIGTGVGVITAVDESVNAVDKYIAQEDQRNAALSGNTTEESAVQFFKAKEEFQEARSEAIMNIGFAAADLGALKIFSKLGSAGVKTAKEYETGAKVIKNMNETMTKAFEKLGAQRMKDFMKRMGEVSEATRIKFLEKLANGKLTPARLEKMAKESLEAAKKCMRP